MIKFNSWPDNSFQQSLLTLPRGKMFTFVENVDDEVKFPNVNSVIDFCKAIVDPDFQATLQNIFVSSAVMFKSYEELLTTFFPEPPCQKLTFKLPTSILPGLHLYEKFPRILALFINKHLKFKSVCTVFLNKDTAPKSSNVQIH